MQANIPHMFGSLGHGYRIMFTLVVFLFPSSRQQSHYEPRGHISIQIVDVGKPLRSKVHPEFRAHSSLNEFPRVGHGFRAAVALIHRCGFI